MLARTLYEDERIALHIHWLGMGALTATMAGVGTRRAHPVQKQFFLAAVNSMAASGQPISPANPAMSLLCKTVAEALHAGHANSLTWRVIFNQGPEEFARVAIEESRR